LADVNIKAAESAAAMIATRHPTVKAIALKTDVNSVEQEIKDAVDLAVKESGRLNISSADPFSRLFAINVISHADDRRLFHFCPHLHRGDLTQTSLP
jgi:hypothetical protein